MSKFLDFWDDLTGVVLPYALKAPPSDKWMMCFGQSLLAGNPGASRLRAKLVADGFPYGQDVDGNPKVPDVRGRVCAGFDEMGGVAAGRLTAGAALGSAIGGQAHVLTTAQMPRHIHDGSAQSSGAHTHDVTGTAANAGGHTHTVTDKSASSGSVMDGIWPNGEGGGQSALKSVNASSSTATTNNAGAHTHSVSGNAASAGNHSHTISVSETGEGEAHSIVQPTIALNQIIRL